MHPQVRITSLGGKELCQVLVWKAVTLERTHCCVLTGLEGTSPMTSHQLEDYSNSPNEKVQRPEKARNGGIRDKKSERGWRQEGQTLRSSEHRRQGNVSGPGVFCYCH